MPLRRCEALAKGGLSLGLKWVSQVFMRCFKVFIGCLYGVYRVFIKCFKVFTRCFKVFLRRFISVLRCL